MATDIEFKPIRSRAHARNLGREKCLLLALIFFILVAIVLLALLLYFAVIKTQLKPVDDKEDDICNTRDCTLTASYLIDAMDPKVDPCSDFYHFVCGNFLRKNLVAEDAPIPKINASVIFNRNYNLQKKVMIENLRTEGKPDVLRRLQEAYHVCLNTTYQKKQELEAFKNFVDNVFDWPLIKGSKWDPNFSRFKTVTDYFAEIAYYEISNPLFKITVQPNQLDPTKDNVFIDMPYFSTNIISRYKSYIAADEKNKTRFAEIILYLKLAKLLGNPLEDPLADEIEGMDRFLKNFKQISRADYSDYPREAKMSIEELNELTEHKIDWLKIINAQRPWKEFSVDHNVTFETSPERFKRVIAALGNDLPIRALHNLVAGEQIILFLPHGGPDIEELYHAAAKSEGFEDDTPVRWSLCLDWVQTVYSAAFTRAFVDKYVNPETRISADELITLIQEAYRKIIQESEWLDDETKRVALKKIDAITRNVGYPDFILVDDELEEEYAYIPTVKSTHFTNYLETKTNSTWELRKRGIKYAGRWIGNPLLINAFYIFMQNSIWFPVGIMQLPYFDDNRIAAVNFGTMGMAIGHEIGHAFDNRGSEYDENGKYKSWWTPETRQIYTSKEQCFNKQYNDFCPEELQSENKSICVDGRWTLGENLADFTGINAAFLAYKLWVEKHGKEKRLPGLHQYTPEQIFFMSYGYIWCESVPIDRWLEVYRTTPHSPGQYRVNGVSANSRDFRQVFNCSEGPMNRGPQSCTLW